MSSTSSETIQMLGQLASQAQVLTNYQAELTDLLNQLLFESGECLVKCLEAKRTDPERQLHFNRALDLTEKCLLLNQCAQKKQVFLEQLLDTHLSDEVVQAQVPYQNLVEQILHITWHQVHQVILKEKDPTLAVLLPRDWLTFIKPYAEISIMAIVPK